MRLMPKVVLYSRVSTEEQAESGYSLAQQLEALRGYAAEMGYEILEEVTDAGQSGASLERPGMDRVRDLVAAGEVTIVLAQDRDRFAREPAYHYLLRQEFGEYGAKMRSLNDRGDESPEGELTDGILDQLAKFDRAKTAERTRRGKRRKAAEGKVIASRHPKYGFALNSTRDGYVVDAPKMALVRRVFEMASRGTSLKSIADTFDREGIPTPGGGRYWDRSVLKSWIFDDAYKPHSHAQASSIVGHELRGDSYGILWWGKRQTSTRQVSELTPEGRRYRKRYNHRITDESERVALAVPDGGFGADGIPRELVDSARERLSKNTRPSSAGDRVWELSGGIARCAECGRALRARRKIKKRQSSSGLKVHVYHHYRCPAYESRGKDECPNASVMAAEALEQSVWEQVRTYLGEPERLRRDLQMMLERKRAESREDPKESANRWLSELTRLENKRAAYQEQHAEELMSTPELREKLSSLERSRAVAEEELAKIRARSEEMLSLEEDVEAMLSRYEGLAPEALDSLSGEQRRSLYVMLGLEVYMDKQREVRVESPLVVHSEEHMEVCPHGRPIVRYISLADLLREFGRS